MPPSPQTLRPDIAYVTVGFCRARGIASRLIEWFGASYYSHVTTLCLDRQNVIDARLRGGVQRRPLSYLAGERIDWYALECTPEQLTTVMGFLSAQIGKRYDVRAIWHFVTGQVRDHNWTHRTAWFCDELAAASWIRAGIAKRTMPTMPLYRITPGGSALILSQLKYRQVEVKI